MKQDTPLTFEGKIVRLPALPKVKVNEVQSEVAFEAELILSCMRQLRNQEGLFTTTGCVHNGAWIKNGEIVFWAEDISRHCMVDKLLGWAVRQDVDIADLAILVSCRITSSIMQKLIHARIVLVASMSAVSNLAIELARENKVTLAGFVRDDRMNIYTGKRIRIQ